MSETLVLVLLATWVCAIAVLVCVDLAERFIWVPVLLALTGVLTSILPLVVSSNIAPVANLATLVLFFLSVQWFRPKSRLQSRKYRANQLSLSTGKP